MTRKVRGRSPAESGMPTAAKLTNVEITQARNLDVEFLAVRQRRTDLTRGMALRPASVWAGERLPCGCLRS